MVVLEKRKMIMIKTECRYCRIFREKGVEMCKYCTVYGHGPRLRADSGSGEGHASVGEYLVSFDSITQEIIRLYRSAGLDWGQIEVIIASLIQSDFQRVLKQEKQVPGRR